MTKYPQRPIAHILEKHSENYLHQIFPAEWILDKRQNDYGTDFECEIVDENSVLGINFSIQLKSKELESNSEFVIIKNIKRSTINRWRTRLEPTLIIAYVHQLKEAYSIWVEENTFDLTKKNKYYQIKIPKRNKLTIDYDWGKLKEYVQKIFNRRYRLYESPTVNNQEERDIWNLYFSNQWEEALIGFKKLLNNNNDQSLIYNSIAACEYNLFNYKKALTAINKALSLNDDILIKQNKASILTHYGQEFRDSQSLQIAKEIWEELLTSERSSVLLYNYGNCLSFLEDHKSALDVYLESLKKDPNNSMAWKNLGSAYNKFEQYDLEIKCYNNALLIAPNLSEALFSKGVTLFKFFNKTKEGLELMLKAEEADVDKEYELHFPYACFWIAEAYLRLREINNAKIWNNRGLQIIPTDDYFLAQKHRISNH